MGIINSIKEFLKPIEIKIPQKNDLRIVELDNGKFEVQIYDPDNEYFLYSRPHGCWKTIIHAYETEEGLLVQTATYTNLKSIEQARKFKELFKSEHTIPKVKRVVEQ